MTSPARRHWLRQTAASNGTSTAATRAAGSEYELMQAGLWACYRDLKGIKAIERKIAYKRDHALPQFKDYVQGVLQADSGEQNNVVMNVMVWRFDIGDLAGGLDIADYAMRHRLKAPDRYERDTLTIVVDEVADQTLARLKAEPAPNGDELWDLDVACQRAERLMGDADIHDQVKAKLLKAIGYVFRAQKQPKAAVGELKRALALNEHIGVKKDIERLDRELNRDSQTRENASENASKNAGDQKKH